jgi:hypothetical protein
LGRSDRYKEAIKLPPSYISFNIDFPIHELESGVDDLLPMVLIDDEIALNQKGDVLYLKVIKKGNLKMALRNNFAHASLPLDVEVAIKKKVMGITFSNRDTPISFTGKIETKASALLDSAWNFSLRCEDMNLIWDEEPSLNILGIDIDMSKTMEKALDQNETIILDKLCNAINRSLDFRKTLTKIWGDIQKPIRIARNPVYVWLYTIPEALNAELLPMENDTLSIHIEYKADIHITTNENIKTKYMELPTKGNTLNDQSAILAYIETAVSINTIEKILSDKLVGKAYTYQDYGATVASIKLSSKKQNVVATVRLSEGMDAEITIQGKPALKKNMKLTLDDFKYEINSSDNLTSTTDWLTHGMVENYLATQVFIDVAAFFEDLDSLANAGIAKSKLGDKMISNLNFREISSYQQSIKNDTLRWIFYLEGSAGITLKKNIFKKQASE